MKPIHIIAAAIAALPGSGSAQGLEQYDVSSPLSELLAFVMPDEDALLSAFSHKHVIKAGRVEGHVLLDPEDPSRCRMDITVPVESLIADPPRLRARLGWEEGPDALDRRDIERTIQDEEQLFSARFPNIRFTGDRCEQRGPAEVLVHGALTIRGERQPVVVPMRVSFNNGRLEAKGSLVVRHRDFGFEPYSNVFGTIRNDEEIGLQIFLVALFVEPDVLSPRRASR